MCAGVISSLGRFVDEPVDPGSVLGDHEFEPDDEHVAWGNPNRFRDGPVRIASDNAWRHDLSRFDSVALSGLCGGVGRRYGYPWRANAELRAARGRLDSALLESS